MARHALGWIGTIGLAKRITWLYLPGFIGHVSVADRYFTGMVQQLLGHRDARQCHVPDCAGEVPPLIRTSVSQLSREVRPLTSLGPIKVMRCAGNEPFHDSGSPLGFDLLSHWQWASSDLVSNATRGILAEYLVAQALGVAADGVREEWAAYDLETPDGTRIEVKSAAYIQNWQQPRLSQISLRVSKTIRWDRYSNRYGSESKRHADVYVFALLAHKEQQTLNPIDVSQCEFFVLPTVVLDTRERSQHSITLPSLRRLAEPVSFRELPRAVAEAGKVQRCAN